MTVRIEREIGGEQTVVEADESYEAVQTVLALDDELYQAQDEHEIASENLSLLFQ